MTKKKTLDWGYSDITNGAQLVDIETSSTIAICMNSVHGYEETTIRYQGTITAELIANAINFCETQLPPKLSQKWAALRDSIIGESTSEIPNAVTTTATDTI